MDSQDAPATGDSEGWLFEPVVGQQTAPWVRGPRPWRVASQVYVAFFGGVVAITAIAFLNARRLGMSVRDQRIIVAIGVVGVVLVASAAAALIDGGTGVDETRDVRFAGRAVGVLMFLLFARMQRVKDRLFSLQSGDYDSLWRAGIAAALLGGIVQAAVVFIVLDLT